MTTSLNSLVHMAAQLLIGDSADDEVAVSEQVLTELAADLNLDVAFLRYNDHDIRATRLIAQWPIRTYIPDPDPIGVVSFVGADPVFAAAEQLKEPLLIRPEPATDEYQSRIQQGTEIPAISMACVPLLSNDITTGTLGFIKYGDREWFDEEVNALQTIAAMFAHLQARSAAIRRLRHLGTHDDLTDLHNSRALIAHLEGRLQSPSADSVAVLFIDLDRLKSVNDYFGHPAGDSLIAQVSQRLRDSFGETCFLARMGGDEFVVVPNSGSTAAQAATIAEHVSETLGENFQLGNSQFKRTVSIGVAVGVAGTHTVKDVLRFADQALLAAKASGGNTIGEYTDALALEQSLRNEVELHLRDGIEIESDALVLHYQPEVDIRSGAVLAVEALVRWNHPTRGLLRPDAFIPVAEQSNLAAALGRRVFRNACKQFQQWRAAGLATDVLLRVNISPVQLVTDGFVTEVALALTEYGIPPSSLSFDLTEHAIATDADTSLITLAELRDLGVGTALDHFGTGYSVLSGLKTLPIDTLKIDRSFVRDLGTNGGDIAIVRSIIALAEAFGLTVIAEGLETAAAAKTLARLGCYRAQGFLLSPPVDATTMAHLLAQPIIAVDF